MVSILKNAQNLQGEDDGLWFRNPSRERIHIPPQEKENHRLKKPKGAPGRATIVNKLG